VDEYSESVIQLVKAISLTYAYNIKGYNFGLQKSTKYSTPVFTDETQNWPVVKISNTQIVKDNILSHTEYEFEIFFSEKELKASTPKKVKKRFSDFVSLFKEWSEDVEFYGNVIPKHPEKNKQIYLWGDHDEFEEGRKLALVFYWKKIFGHWKLRGSPAFKRFLGGVEPKNSDGARGEAGGDWKLGEKTAFLGNFLRKNVMQGYQSTKGVIMNQFSTEYGQLPAIMGHASNSFIFLADEKFFITTEELLQGLIQN
jgi:hypothetical protein